MEEMGKLIIHEKPILNRPRLLIGLDGWPNAAGVSTTVVTYLIKKLKARKFAEIEPSDFYLLSSSRPTASINAGKVETYIEPTSDFYYWSNGGSKDLVCLLAREPDMRWKEYVNLVYQIINIYGIERVYIIGGINGYVPHTRDIKVSAVVNSPKLKSELTRYDIEFVDYQGPTSIHTFFNNIMTEGTEVVSLWGRAPIYIKQNPMIYYAVLKRLVAILGLNISLKGLRSVAQATQEQVNKQISKNPALLKLVGKLEDAYDKQEELDKVESEDIIKSIEEWLERKKG